MILFSDDLDRKNFVLFLSLSFSLCIPSLDIDLTVYYPGEPEASNLYHLIISIVTADP